MRLITHVATCGLVAASLWTTSEARAGDCHSGSCHRVYRAPVINYHPVHHDDYLHGGGPGGGGPGGTFGGGPGGPGGGGLGGSGGGGPGGGGQGGQGQGQNGQGQNGNVPAIQVPAGAQITLTGVFGPDSEVYLNINNVKLPLVIDQATDSGLVLTLPAVKLQQAQNASIEVVTKGKTDSIAILLNPKPRLVVNGGSQPSGLGIGVGGEGGGRGGNAPAGGVAGVQ